MLIRIVVVAALAAAAVLAWMWYQEFREPAVPPELTTISPPEREPSEPRHPVPEPLPEPGYEIETDPPGEAEQPRPLPELPPLEDSDGWIHDRLAELAGAQAVENWLVDERLIERAVVFVNSLDADPIPQRMWPLQPAPGPARVREGEDDRLLWDEANADRYAPVIAVIETVSPEAAARFYLNHYRLFQQAYAEMAGSGAYFNDRLVEVIDHLLATPDFPEPIEVESWEGRYRFADESLEEQSSGRKMLLRMSNEQARELREWLEEVRSHITDA